jgi:hypothetical protein
MRTHLSFDKALESMDITFDDLITQFPDIETKALNTGAYILRRGVVESMIQRWPASGRPFTVKVPKRPGTKKPYITQTTPISEGVKQSKRKGDIVTVSVAGSLPHTAGYLAKMYDHDSRPRMTNHPKRYVGKLTGKNYFRPGIASAEQECMDAMERIITKRLNDIITNGL